MENEIKSVSDIIAEISKKDKKRQVFILTNLINQLKSTRTEANIKRGSTIVDGTILETKSKYPINTFENESSKEVSR